MILFNIESIDVMELFYLAVFMGKNNGVVLNSCI